MRSQSAAREASRCSSVASTATGLALGPSSLAALSARSRSRPPTTTSETRSLVARICAAGRPTCPAPPRTNTFMISCPRLSSGRTGCAAQPSPLLPPPRLEQAHGVVKPAQGCLPTVTEHELLALGQLPDDVGDQDFAALRQRSDTSCPVHRRPEEITAPTRIVFSDRL